MNCSQKLISLIFGTTYFLNKNDRFLLWIALKSWYLWYSEQPTISHPLLACCCELLSKVDIFDIRNNNQIHLLVESAVVNCSQKLISLIFGTTFKKSYKRLSRCELLSKVDIFDIRNNYISSGRNPIRVVNCSQKLISLIFGTTCFNSVHASK